MDIDSKDTLIRELIIDLIYIYFRYHVKSITVQINNITELYLCNYINAQVLFNLPEDNSQITSVDNLTYKLPMGIEVTFNVVNNLSTNYKFINTWTH